ncbi:hypothetical protein BJV78DRAFT_764472 [Lactifluus subvellereus]|nr:hypothetical protein BJV78DRAFT_764472 [Lactifluus subvellereus]
MQRHGNKRTPAEFKELREKWRNAKKDETDCLARLERAEERYTALRTLQYPSQLTTDRPDPTPMEDSSFAAQGYPVHYQLAVVGASAGSSLGADMSVRPLPLQPQYGYPISGAARSLYPVALTTLAPST